MKKCPYCAEEIQDEAIKCRYCYSDLTVPPEVALKQVPPAVGTAPQPGVAPSPGTGQPSPSVSAPEPVPGEIRYSHSGYRYVLGYGPDFFGIWDRQAPATPAERFPRTDDGWRQAWVRFASLEPKAVPVSQDQAGSANPTTGVSGVSGEPVIEQDDVVAIKYTHSGTRYLLGYGRTFFGIWDRESPARPAERFPRTDQGWTEAWRRYTQLESNFVEVK